MSKNSNSKAAKGAAIIAPSIIGSDVKITGDISTLGELQLDGIVEGNINCGSITMGELSSVKGIVTADSLVARGTIEGTINARSVRLEKSSEVNGDVWHETLSVEAGARIEGNLVHADNKSQPGEQPAMPEAQEEAEAQAQSEAEVEAGTGIPASFLADKAANN
jgi:cytoskeletal protein CcmA (bactofilin family)